MVLASNQWLSNSGDDQKTSRITSLNCETATQNTATVEDFLTGSMSILNTTCATSCSDEVTEKGLTTATAAIANSLTTISTDNANQNNREEEEHYSFEQITLDNSQISLSETSKTMATTNNGSSDYSVTDGALYLNELETSRTTISPNNMDLNDGVEMDNNNHSFTALIDATFGDVINSGGLDSESIDSNINTLAGDLTAKSSVSVTTTATSNPSSDILASQQYVFNKGDQTAFLNTLTNSGGGVGGGIGNIVNANNSAAINNAANAMGNKVNAFLFSIDASRSSSLSNSGSNSAGSKSTNSNSSDSLASSNNGQAKIVLICEQSSHPFQTRTISLTPNIECKVGRLIAKCKASESNAIFDCKVLSRNHAVLWYSDDGKFWVKDTKSSNGTFINDNKLGNEAAELHYGDIVKFGVDVVENSRKEVHGCIIACVKLYLPDGREAISIESNGQRSQYSGESRISFEDLHRLNVYMQETSQREKALKSKLYNIQNLLDATRKNSSTCWQAMISEDQLLHRIHSLEKKIQILEKNMPENALKNEIMKLIDDKSAYQHSAKEALRSVYLERCEAMQKLAKLESDFASSENECKILRDQITCTEEALQDVNDRLRLLETEYSDYRTEAEREQLEAKSVLEQRINELTEKMHLREEECDLLRTRIAELLEKRTTAGNRKDSHSDEAKLEKQVIENLDAVIANMDICDDDDDDDEDDEEDAVDQDVEAAVRKQRHQRQRGGDSYDFNGSSDSSGNEKTQKAKVEGSSDQKATGEESTIMKWLQNSDLNKKEGSFDIFKAICNNESDSSDEHDVISPGAGAEEFLLHCTKVTNKLQTLKNNLNQLEIEYAEDFGNQKIKIESESTDFDKEIDSSENNEDRKSNSQLKSVEIMKMTVELLNEAYEEICINFKQLQEWAVMKRKQQQQQQSSGNVTSTATQFQKINNSSSSAVSNKALPEINEVENEHDSDDDDDDNDEGDDEDGGEFKKQDNRMTGKQKRKKLNSQVTVVEKAEKQDEDDKLLRHYQQKIDELQDKLNERDENTQHMMEMLQVECDGYKEKVADLLKMNEMLRVEKDAALSESAMQHLITSEVSTNRLKLTSSDDVSGDGVSSDSGMSCIDKTTETLTHAVTDTAANTTISGNISEAQSAAIASAAFEQQMREELAAINSTAMQREEELITYKESLEQTRKENLKLRDEISQMQKGHVGSSTAIMRMAVPMGVAVIGVLAYLIITYL